MDWMSVDWRKIASMPGLTSDQMYTALRAGLTQASRSFNCKTLTEEVYSYFHDGIPEGILLRLIKDLPFLKTLPYGTSSLALEMVTRSPSAVMRYIDFPVAVVHALSKVFYLEELIDLRGVYYTVLREGIIGDKEVDIGFRGLEAKKGASKGEAVAYWFSWGFNVNELNLDEEEAREMVRCKELEPKWFSQEQLDRWNIKDFIRGASTEGMII